MAFENPWDSFWSGLDKAARTHPLVAGAMDGIGELNKGMGKVVYSGPPNGNFINNNRLNLGSLNLQGGTWGGNNAPKMEQAANTRDPRMDRVGNADGSTTFPEQILPPKKSKMDELWDSINQEYDGAPVGEDDILSQVLNSKLEAINGARGQAQEAFNTSDRNVAGMHEAFRNEILGQAPRLQEQNQQHQGNIASVFDQALGQNDQRAAENKARDEEMYQRLGIAPAAAAPDLVGQAIAEGNNRLTGSKTSRLGEAATLGQVDLQRNTGMANAVGNDGLARRSELNGRLQQILGDLGSAESEARVDILGRSNDQAKETEQRKYERFIGDRDFSKDLYGQMNDMNAKTIQAQAKASAQGGGIDELIATTNPAVVQGIQDLMATEQDVDTRNPADVLYRLRKKGVNLNPTEVEVYLRKQNNLSKSNNVTPVDYGQ